MSPSTPFDLPVPMDLCTPGRSTPSRVSEVCSSAVKKLKHKKCVNHTNNLVNFTFHSKKKSHPRVTYLLGREDGTSCCLRFSGDMVRNRLSRQTLAADNNPMCEYVRLLAGATFGPSSHATLASTRAGTSPKQVGVLSPGTRDCSSVDADRSTAWVGTRGEMVVGPETSLIISAAGRLLACGPWRSSG